MGGPGMGGPGMGFAGSRGGFAGPGGGGGFGGPGGGGFGRPGGGGMGGGPMGMMMMNGERELVIAEWNPQSRNNVVSLK